MSSSSIRLLPRRSAVLGAVLALGLLVGCTGQQDPGDYSDDVRDNFVAGCDGSAFTEEAEATTLVTLPTAQCECIYAGFEENIDFSDFKSANSDRRDEPTALDDPEFQAVYDQCGPNGPLAEGESNETGGVTTTTEG